jgi:hypothetical protein
MKVQITMTMSRLVDFKHGVDRVLIFFPNHLNWDSPTPSPAGDPVLPTFGSGGGTHSLTGEGVGGSQFGLGNRACGTIQNGDFLSLTGGARGGADLTPLHQHQREYEGCHGRGANLSQLRGINPG